MSKSPKYRMVPPMRTGEPPLIGRAKVDVSIRAQLEGHPEYKRRHLYETQRVRDNLCAAIAKAENVGEAP